MKRCTICKEAKPFDQYTNRAASKDGLYPQCTPCKNEVQARQRLARAEARKNAGYIPPTEKPCIKCGEVKPLDEFHNSPTAKTGKRGDCKECSLAAAAERAKANINRFNSGRREAPAYKTCPDCGETKSPDEFTLDRSNRDGLCHKCKTCMNAILRERGLKTRYGITTAERDRMLAEQGGVCANCGSPEHGGKNWGVDHDHACCPGKKTCGKCIAGILCNKCNMAIGLLGDDPELIMRTAEYVRRTRRR